RVQPDIDAARDDPECDVRRHLPPVAKGYAAGLDRFEAEFPGHPVGRLSAPAKKMRIGYAAPVLRAVVEAVRTGLPDLAERIGHRPAEPVDDPSLDQDALAFGIGAGDDEAEVVTPHAIDLDPVRIGADVDIGAGRLRRRLAQVIERLDHQFPSSLFSNGVE